MNKWPRMINIQFLDGYKVEMTPEQKGKVWAIMDTLYAYGIPQQLCIKIVMEVTALNMEMIKDAIEKYDAAKLREGNETIQ